MGGIDRSDQNIELYRIAIRGKKWYFPLFTHCIDLAIQNAWQLYRSDGGDMDQLQFRRRIASTLLAQNKKPSTYHTGRLSKNMNVDIRYDRLEHYVTRQEKQTRCGHCHQRATTRCRKCNIAVHVQCFVDYHTQK